MNFQTIRIQNYKAIQDMELEFQPGINLLVGDNGTGKTSILEAITVVLGGYLSGVAGVYSKGILQSDVRIETSALTNASSAIEYKVPVSIECTMDMKGQRYTWSRTRENETGSSRTKTNHREIANYAIKLVNDLHSQLPLISFMGTNRVSQSRREDFGSKAKKKLDDRRCGYIGCLDGYLDIKSIKAWCLKMEMVAFQQNQPVEEYEAFKHLISSVMKAMTELDYEPVIAYSRLFEDIVYSDETTTLPISYLSAGYQSLLWMVMDLAYRLAILNPKQKNFEQATGIVLIDEIDMHLHPKWQWNVLSTLETTFPNIQFIIATHSPIVISACKSGRLIYINQQQQIQYLNTAYGYSIDNVVELRQGSFNMPKALKQMVRQFDEAMNEEEYDQAHLILESMKVSFGADNSEVKKAMLDLEVGSMITDWD